MSKTIETQIEKCRLLTGKLKEKSTEAEAMGITAGELGDMERRMAELAEASVECDRLRSEMSECVKRTNMMLADLKDVYIDMKKKVKESHPQERWADYGVPDKR